jgi:SecD/SecF fusion protein
MFNFSRWKVTLICLVAILGVIYAAPNLMKQSTLEKFPNWAPKEQVSLGLDLQGGSHLLLEIDFATVMKEQLHSLQDGVRSEMRKNKIKYRDMRVEGKHLIVELEDAASGSLLQSRVHEFDSTVEIKIGGDGVATLGFSPMAISQKRQDTLRKSIEIVQRRVDETGTKEPVIQSQGDNRILVQLPGLKDPKRIKDLLGKTAKMTFQMIDENTSASDATRGRIPPGSELLPDQQHPEHKYVVKKRVVVSGDSLVDAYPSFIQESNQWVVNFRFDMRGARRFGDATAKNIGKKFAIILDKKVISAPNIKSAITGGQGYIEGGFTPSSANDLAVLMRAGALPAPLITVEERTVGADLGTDSINAGRLASMLGLALILVFMLMYYGFFGTIADIGLVFNMVILIAILSVLGVTLTLPGIAGIVLTMGMAVDSNVLINERIDEEIRSGSSVVNAIEVGYQRALTSIIDSNLTTLIAATSLYYFGSGPVKGFAVTLAIGLLISMFTAITVTRLLIAGWWMKRRPTSLKVHLMRLIPAVTKFNFLGARKVAVLVSVVLLIGSAALMVTKGMNFGIDFKGGILIELRTQEAAELASMRDKLNALNMGDVALQEFGSDKDILLRIERQEGDEKAQMKAVEIVKSTLNSEYAGIEYRRVDFVGPKVSEGLMMDAMLAIAFSLLAILIYVWFRFEWQFGVCAVLALVHDAVATLGFIALMGIEFNLTIVAALLTILGYSINDTVIIFDRVRENLKKHRDMSIPQLLNLSLNETLSRTTMTVLTVLLVLFSLYFFGGQVLSGFSMVLIWGMVAGTYSSIFVSVLLLDKLKITHPKEEGEEDEDIGFQPQD